MKKVILILAVLVGVVFLSGCTVWKQSEFNDKNIVEFKKCTEAGMATGINGSGEILCTIPKEK